ncbi:hypothetical protein A3K89_22290 [Rhodococcoides kyotonense]|uniref:Uncharacterized protein n=2 Tax=Mycobacteriales TaxID=85007 RepID=A0A177YFF5_9NOCA|nr:hypothetical protein A3K89_22290 [Rhodococcus kyotonensis]
MLAVQGFRFENVSVTGRIIGGMRIRTLIGPPLQQEIVRSTAVAIALCNLDPEHRADRAPGSNRSQRRRPVAER